MRSFAIWLVFAHSLVPAQASGPFVVHVTDDATGRGVPLVELRTLNEIAFITDSAGIAVIDDAALLGHAVVFHVRSHGYEFQQKFLDQAGVKLDVSASGR